MKERLMNLIAATQSENRDQWPLKYKEAGEKVIGIIAHQFIPQEIIYAAGALPVRLIGSWAESAPLGERHRSKISCRYCTNILENVLSGKYDYLDGIIAAGYDDDVRTTWDVMDYYKKVPYTHIMFVPHKTGQLDVEYWLKEIEVMRKQVEELTGNEVTDEKLFSAIKVYNHTREMMAELYELRKQEAPPITGSELLGIQLAASVMPREEFNRELEALIPYIKTRKPQYASGAPRVLLSSDHMDDLRYLSLLESAGCIIAMDDLDTGSRSMLGHVDEEMYNPEYSLAKFYLTTLGTCPHYNNWDKQIENVRSWVNEYRIDGVIELPVLYSFPREFLTPYYQTQMQEKEMPMLSVRREYGFSNEGQLSTRIGAFVEMIAK